jgi:DNA polymerase I-like protein with 3'-5' exonuclease and polymerase domains
MLVTVQDFDTVVKKLTSSGKRGLDTETTGVRQSDRLFSIIIADADEGYYFNFNDYDSSVDASCVLPRSYIFRLQQIFSNPDSVWYIHNAKFDLRMLANEGIEILGRVHCSFAAERIIQNNHMNYSLDACAARRGWKKDDKVKEFADKNKLYTKVSVPGKRLQIKEYHYEKVDPDLMLSYGLWDGELHRRIGLDQELQVEKLSNIQGFPSIRPVFENEMRLVKTLFKMEQRGVRVDKPYIANALEWELNKVREAQREFTQHTGEQYESSPKLFKKVFDAVGEPYPKTDKGNPSFAADVLEGMSSPVASIINRIRHHEKKAGTYYSSFLYHAGTGDVIHANARQAGTETGRLSYSDPNLQNVPKEGEPEDFEKPYLVRGSFVPREGHFFYSIDYEQQEFRMMLDYAGEKDLIAAIMNGADVHQATADMLGISRKFAKTINFGLLYGMGPMKLAAALGISLAEAKGLMTLYFGKLPKVKRFIDQVIRAGEGRGFIFNWYGRRSNIAMRKWAYILPNHLIQGGCADVIKVAMNRIDDAGFKSPMLLQVHDELLIECPFGAEREVEKIRQIMEKAYTPQNGMYLTTSVEHSFKSWSARDKIKGTPYESKSA